MFRQILAKNISIYFSILKTTIFCSSRYSPLKEYVFSGFNPQPVNVSYTNCLLCILKLLCNSKKPSGTRIDILSLPSQATTASDFSFMFLSKHICEGSPNAAITPTPMLMESHLPCNAKVGTGIFFVISIIIDSFFYICIALWFIFYTIIRHSCSHRCFCTFCIVSY